MGSRTGVSDDQAREDNTSGQAASNDASRRETLAKVVKPNGASLASSSALSPNARLVWVFGVGTCLLLALCIAALVYSNPISTKNATAAGGVIALVTALAVGIERVLEGFWTIVEQITKSKWSPLRQPGAWLTAFADQLTGVAAPVIGEANKVLADAKGGVVKLEGSLADANGAIASLEEAIRSIESTQDLSRDLQVVKATMSRVEGALRNAGVTESVRAAKDGLDALTALAGSVLNNPGRRLMSLLAGSTMGVAIVALFGLDVFHAALGLDAPVGGGRWYFWPQHPQWGIMVTGIVAGLGSNPTHELIKAIQEYKQKQAAS